MLGLLRLVVGKERKLVHKGAVEWKMGSMEWRIEIG